MGVKSKLKDFFALEDEYYEDEVNEQEVEQIDDNFVPRSRREKKQQNIVSLQSVQQQAKVLLLEPRSYSEVQEIADHLKSRKAIVMNLQRIPLDQAKRIVDFLSGTVYAIGGDIQKIGPNTFLCTSDNIELSGSISEMVMEDE